MAFGINFRELLPDLEDDARRAVSDGSDRLGDAFDSGKDRARAELDDAGDRLRTFADDDAPDWLDARLEDLERSFDRLRDELDEVRPWLKDEARPWLDARLDDLQDAFDRLELEGDLDRARDSDVFDGDTFRLMLDRAGLGDLGEVDIRNLDDLAALADRLPDALAGPDDTGEVPTGSADIGREQAAVAAGLSAAARIVEALGPETARIEVFGRAFDVAETYRDPLTGFSALRLASRDGGPDVFSIDGLQVGARADEVAAATLGRLQLTSDAFAGMIEDAAGIAAAGGPVLFAAPSLGGAVAQAAAYFTAEALLATGGRFETGDVQLVTVDALGGRDATEWRNGGALDEAALDLITALNLRTEGDIVSRIGSHVGATKTLAALDENGREVVLDAGDAHVNTVSLLQTLGREDLFAQGRIGAPEEISGFARASEATSEELISTWLAFGTEEEPQRALQIRGRGSFDEAGTAWSLDLNEDGAADLIARFSAPVGGNDGVIA